MRGLSLLELMIVCAIISILAAFSLPVYSHYLVRAKRLQAAIELTHLAAALERYYTLHNTYQEAALGIAKNDSYQFIVSAATDSEYRLVAKPRGRQAEQDTLCGALTLNALGEKGITGPGRSAECW